MDLRIAADVICEKPLVLNPWNVDALIELEEEYANKVYTILQLRHHEAILELKDKIANGSTDKVYDIDLTYITSRGIGIIPHGKEMKVNLEELHQILEFIFLICYNGFLAQCRSFSVNEKTKDTNAGTLQLKQANVNWYLSIESKNLPEQVKQDGLTTFRTLSIEGELIEFSKGFTDLHTVSYQKILEGYRLWVERCIKFY